MRGRGPAVAGGEPRRGRVGEPVRLHDHVGVLGAPGPRERVSAADDVSHLARHGRHGGVERCGDEGGVAAELGARGASGRDGIWRGVLFRLAEVPATTPEILTEVYFFFITDFYSSFSVAFSSSSSSM